MNQAQQARSAALSDLPQYPVSLMGTRGVYHAMLLSAPHSPEQERWFVETCDQVEAFITFASFSDEEALPCASFAIHYLADVLFGRLGAEACWSAISLPDLATLRARMDAPTAGVTFSVLAAFYSYLGACELIDPGRASYWARSLRSLCALERDARPSRSAAERRQRRAARKRTKQARRKGRKR